MAHVVTTATLRKWQQTVEQAMACIRGETPEDCKPGEAEDDTFSKLRDLDAEIHATINR